MYRVSRVHDTIFMLVALFIFRFIAVLTYYLNKNFVFEKLILGRTKK